MVDHSETADFAAAVDAFGRDWDAIAAQVRSVIVGHERVIDEVLTCLVCGGHALLEGVPGLGKTLLVRTLADALELSFSRIQFTPDLMPADITGTNIVVGDESGGKQFRFQGGPVFANLVLADEINRATPKTQSAILEAMQEKTVSAGGKTRPLALPFFVLATQNPLEMEGTYPLPEAQLDRFMFKVNVLSPDVAEIAEIVDRTTGAETPGAAPVAGGERILQMGRLAREVPLAGSVRDYVARIVRATHPDGAEAPEFVTKYVRYGASPRAARAMALSARVAALRAGRANVAFADVRESARPAMRHRLILSFEGQADGIDPDEIVAAVLDAIDIDEAV